MAEWNVTAVDDPPQLRMYKLSNCKCCTDIGFRKDDAWYIVNLKKCSIHKADLNQYLFWREMGDDPFPPVPSRLNPLIPGMIRAAKL